MKKMIICISGDVHGKISDLYKTIEKFESMLGVKFDALLQVGDFGIWIDEKRHDGITKLHNKTGEFPFWYKNIKKVPLKTYFIHGNNEDCNFLESIQLSGDFEIIEDLFYIPNGTSVNIADNNESVIVGGVGGKYSMARFNDKEAKRYYTKSDIDSLIKENMEKNKIDIILTHDAPEGVLIEDNNKNKYYPVALGLRKFITEIKPSIAFFGHHHGICRSRIDKIPVYGLNVIDEKGSLFAIKSNLNQFDVVGIYP